MSTTPIVKWVGGKARLLHELQVRVPSSYGRYYEPFAGGAALFFKLAPKRAVLNDANPALIGMYHALIEDVEGVIAELEYHAHRHKEDANKYYYQVRSWWNDPGRTWTATSIAGVFIYLNKTCFNGLWRVNKSGGFNVPMGDYKNPAICRPDELRAAAEVLKRAELRTGHYWAAVQDAKAGDLVYFDPPYAPLTKTSDFTAYTADGFGVEAQRYLADCARELVARGVHVILSNSDTPLIRELYATDGAFRFDVVKCARSINSDASKRGAVNEVMICSEHSVLANALGPLRGACAADAET